jgi:uncharacterized protein YigA (DUF484 family)
MSKQQAGEDGTPKRAKAMRTGSKAGARTAAAVQDHAESDATRESSVADYLRGHPDFFERHPDVLALMHIHHDVAGAVSLIEHQVAALRRQLDTERGRLAHLISRAREYETLSTRHHDLVLHLIPALDLNALNAVLHEVLRREFSAEAVALKLFPVDPGDSVAGREDPLVTAFRDFLDRPHALCGPLDPEQGRILFGEAGAGLHSAVLVPIRAGARSGVLAIGAAERERFGADMRTDLLDRLGEVVSAKLRSIQGATEGTGPVQTKGETRRVARAKPRGPTAAPSREQAPKPGPKQGKPRAQPEPAAKAGPAPGGDAQPAPGRRTKRTSGSKVRIDTADGTPPTPDVQTATE